MTEILRPHQYALLDRALGEATSARPDLETTANVLLQPLRTLEALNRETAGIFAGELGSMNRVRPILSSLATSVLAQDRGAAPGAGGEREPALASADGKLCEPAIVHLGAVVETALAAALCAPANRRENFAETVLGVAAAAAPAEMLVRALADGMQTEQLMVVLDGLTMPRRSDTLIRAAQDSFLDSCTVALNRCLRDLRARLVRELPGQWHGAVSDGIRGVSVRQGGSQLVIALASDFHARLGDEHFDRESLLEEFEELGVEVVLASRRHPPVLVGPVDIDPSDGTITIDRPDGALAGWVGLTSASMRDAAQQTRSTARASWAKANEQACLAGNKVDVSLFGPATPQGDAPVVPAPYTPGASWGARIIDVSIDDPASTPSGSASVRVMFAPASTADQPVSVVVDVDGEPHFLTVEGDVATGIVPLEPDADDWRVEVFSSSSDASDDVYPGNALASTPREGPRVVLLLPALVSDDKAFDRVSAIKLFRRRLRIEPPPAVADEDLVISDYLFGVEDPAAAGISERLSALAARTSGLEDAIWVALVPNPDGEEGFARVVRDPSAAAVAVATLDHLAEVLGVEAGPASKVIPRLRLMGRISPGDVVLTEAPRITLRAEGAGAENVTPIVAVGRDEHDNPLHIERIYTANPARSGPFVAYLPAGEELRSVELRYQPQTLGIELQAQPRPVGVYLQRIEGKVTPLRSPHLPFIAPRRPDGPLPLTTRGRGPVKIEWADVEIETASFPTKTTLQWAYKDDRGRRPRVVVELGRGDVWTRVATPDPRALSTTLDVRPSPFTAADRVRVVTVDGWDTDTFERELEGMGSTRVRIRRGPGDLYWADVAGDADSVEWSYADSSGALIASAGTGPKINVDAKRYAGDRLVATLEKSTDVITLPEEP